MCYHPHRVGLPFRRCRNRRLTLFSASNFRRGVDECYSVSDGLTHVRWFVFGMSALGRQVHLYLRYFWAEFGPNYRRQPLAGRTVLLSGCSAVGGGIEAAVKLAGAVGFAE